MQIEQLGPYKIGRKLGRGGMGTVYEGNDSKTGELAAIKVLSAAMAQDEGFRERFEGEIETLKKMRHPNIVRLFAFGEEQGLMFYAMELVRGTSLEDELQAARRFDWRDATQIGIKLSRALKHAHDHGVIHRDIKPANIMVTPEGDVKLSDFGIAKLFGATGLTADRGVIGTAEYMSPEQADGRPVTHRSDLYSVGGVLYALIAGRPPFRAKSIPDMLHMQKFAVPDPLRRYSTTVPDEFEAIVLQLLEKEPDKRIPNAMILARRLEAMEHALVHRPLERERERQAAQEQAEQAAREQAATNGGTRVLLPNSPSVNLGPVDSQALTKLDPAESARKSIALQLGASPGLGETMATSPPSAEGLNLAVSNSLAPAPKISQPSRFTTVSEEEEQDEGFRETLATLVSPQTWALVAALVVVGLGWWWLLQPRSADKLHTQIMALAGEENEERLAEAEDEVKEFLQYYSTDPRSRKIEQIGDEIERQRQERRFDRRARQPDKVSEFSPVERAYAEAMKTALADPEEGIRLLQALVDVYDDQQSPPGSENVAQALRLARKQLARLKPQATAFVVDGKRLIQDRLQRAEHLSPVEPAEAEKIWRGIIDLYERKPWATELVEQARAKLATQTAATQSGTAAKE